MAACKHGVAAAAAGDVYPPEPRNYVAWHEWAEKMSETHRQTRCPGCGLFLLWVPRQKRLERAAGAPGGES